MAFSNFLSSLARRPEEDYGYSSDYLSSFNQPVEQSRSGIGPMQMPQIPLPSNPVPSHVPRNELPRIGPEPDAHKRLMAQFDTPVHGGMDMDAIMAAQRQINAENPPNILDAPSLVSVFGATPAAIAARKAATIAANESLERLMQQGRIPAGQADQVRRLAEKYPRVMAHQEGFAKMPSDMADAGQLGGVGFGSKSGKSIIDLSTEAKDRGNFASQFIHELTHGAQHISLKDLMVKTKEDAAERIRLLYPYLDDYEVYRNIPHERSAFRSMSRTTPEPNWFNYHNEPVEDMSVKMPSFWDQLNRLHLRYPGRPNK